MRQHREHHMVLPAGIFAHFIVVHPQLGLAFFEALFHGPAQPTEPDQGAQGRARWGMTDIVRLCWLTSQWPLAHQPDGAIGQTILAQRDAVVGKRIRNRPFGAFGHGALIPA